MKQWEADFTNDPNDDYNIVVEILYGDEDVAVIKRSDSGLVIKWYPGKGELTVPINWLSSLFAEAERRMDDNVQATQQDMSKGDDFHNTTNKL